MYLPTEFIFWYLHFEPGKYMLNMTRIFTEVCPEIYSAFDFALYSLHYKSET